MLYTDRHKFARYEVRHYCLKEYASHRSATGRILVLLDGSLWIVLSLERVDQWKATSAVKRYPVCHNIV